MRRLARRAGNKSNGVRPHCLTAFYACPQSLLVLWKVTAAVGFVASAIIIVNAILGLIATVSPRQIFAPASPADDHM